MYHTDFEKFNIKIQNDENRYVHSDVNEPKN